MNYYEVLGVPKNADNAAIKKAYRRKSKECHPDRKGGDSTAMVWVNKAYETLSDPEKRAYYDACGQDKPLNTLEQHARSILFECALHAVLNAPDSVGLVSAIRQTMDAKRGKIRESLRQPRSQLAKLKKHAAALTCEGEENELGRFFEDQMVLLNDSITKLEEQEKAVEMAVEKLNLYKSAIEAKQNQAPMMDRYTALFGTRTSNW